MAKVPKIKQKPSVRSRAARRADSPTSVGGTIHKDTSAAHNAETSVPDVLAARNDAGISKRKKKTKPLKRQQRLRKENGMARAAAFSDQLEEKIGRSKKKGKVVKERRAAWDEWNDALHSGKPKSKKTLERRVDQDDAMKDVVDDSPRRREAFEPLDDQRDQTAQMLQQNLNIREGSHEDDEIL